jgi:hypothetical protein
VVDLDAAFGEQLLDVAVGDAITQVPAHRDPDDLTWETGTPPERTTKSSR